MFFEFFRECVYIMHIELLKFKRYGNDNEKTKGNDTAPGY